MKLFHFMQKLYNSKGFGDRIATRTLDTKLFSNNMDGKRTPAVASCSDDEGIAHQQIPCNNPQKERDKPDSRELLQHPKEQSFQYRKGIIATFIMNF